MTGFQFVDPEEFARRVAEEHDRHHMAQEVYVGNLRRLFAEELTWDQAATLSKALNGIVESPDPARAAAYLEGLLDGCLTVRDLRLGEKPGAEVPWPDPVPEPASRPQPEVHPFEESKELDDPYCGREGCGLPPANRVHRTEEPKL